MEMRIITRIMGVVVMTLGLGACSGCSHMSIEMGDERPFEKPLPINTSLKKLTIGYAASVGVKEDGTLWSWGTNLNGALGFGKDEEQRFVPTPIPDMTNFAGVEGETHFLALRKNGTVWSWGENRYGQLGYETTQDKFKGYYESNPSQIPGLNNIISIAAALGHSLALDDSGNVYAFGSNRNQQLGLNPKNNDRHVVPQIVYKNNDAVKVIAGPGASAVLTKNGEIIYWGGNTNKIIPIGAGVDGTDYAVLPVQITTPESCSDFVIGGAAVYCLSSRGFVWAAGLNTVGKLGQGDRLPYEGFVRVKNIGRIISLVSDGLSVSALDESGEIWQWGESVRWQSRAGAISTNVEPDPIKRPGINKPISLYAGTANAAFTADGNVYYWGGARLGKRGTGRPSEEYQVPENWMGPELSLWKWK